MYDKVTLIVHLKAWPGTSFWLCLTCLHLRQIQNVLVMHSHFSVHKSTLPSHSQTQTSQFRAAITFWFMVSASQSVHRSSQSHHSHVLFPHVLVTLTSSVQSLKWKVFLPVLGIFHFVFCFLRFTIAHCTNWKRQKRTIKKTNKPGSHTVGRSFVTVPSDVDLDCKSNHLLKNTLVPGESANHSRLIPLRWRRLIWEIGNHVFIWVFIGIQSTEVKWSQRRDDNSERAVSLLP